MTPGSRTENLTARPWDVSVSVRFELWVMGQLTASLARRGIWRGPEA